MFRVVSIRRSSLTLSIEEYSCVSFLVWENGGAFLHIIGGPGRLPVQVILCMAAIMRKIARFDR